MAAARPGSTAGGELGPAELLLGLLAEPECRAALLATARGIDFDAVREHWPELEAVPPALESAAAERINAADQLSSPVREALRVAELHRIDYPEPHMLATEHLLLGLATGDNEVAQWLAAKGWDTAELGAEIDRLAGHDRGPLPIDFDSPTDGPPCTTAAPLPDALQASPAVPVGDEPDNEQTALGEESIVDREAIARLRILDAAGNRAGEAVRVIEDYARFGLDDRHLAGECKALRHALTLALSVFPTAQRHAARETRTDVGTTLSLESERQRADLRAVVGANFKRLEQALQLGGICQGVVGPAAAALEQLRYRTYTLERAINITANSLDRLAGARLYVLVDGRESADALARWVDILVAAGVDVIQLRDKRLADRDLLARARVVRRQTRGTKTLFIMNDRPDLARLAYADGVHVGQEELKVKEARTIVGPEALVGVSTHSVEQAREAVLDGANYIGVGPVFPSATKQFAQFPGLELLRAVSAEIRLPAFAIGGICAANVDQVRACGFSRIAVSGAVSESPTPADAARELKQRLS